jgi:hypothetical protein
MILKPLSTNREKAEKGDKVLIVKYLTILQQSNQDAMFGDW